MFTRSVLIVVAIIFVYAAFSTFFHDTTLVGNIGRTIGEGNISIFGYLAYIDLLLLLYPIYRFYRDSSLFRRPDLIVGWILFFISLILLQALTAGLEHSGYLGRNMYLSLLPYIGKAGLWLLWLMTFSLSIALCMEEYPDISSLKAGAQWLTKRFIQRREESHDERGNGFIRLWEESIEYLRYLFHPSRKKEMEKIKRMRLDPFEKLSRNHEYKTEKREEYRELMMEELEREEMLVENLEKAPVIDKMKISQEEKVENTRPQDDTGSESLPENEKSPLPDNPEREKKRRKKSSSKKVKVVKELEENRKLLEDIEKGKVEKPRNFKLPKLDFLQKPPRHTRKVNEAEIDRKIGELLDKLARFKIEGDVIRTYSGPLVTTFEFKPAPNVKVSKILGLQDDLAMALRAETIRIQAPIPGKDVVGIEIPNDQFDTIYLRDILESEIFKKSASPLTVALGKDIVGNPFITDLKKLPHLLIAGTTGSGKSVGINAMLLSLLYRNDPDSLKLILIDPKMLEFSIYNDIPHLLTPVIVEPKKAIAALANMVNEMERRYRLMSENKVKNIENYNAKVRREGGEELPYIVVVIDELADLMMTGGKDVEYSIARLAQMARAAGIHLIIATQRPSVDVVTGLIKANLPSRLSYRVGQKIDSKVILDQMGADSLLGRGDALFTPPGANGLVRLHAPWNTEEEIEAIVDFLKAQREPDYDETFLSADAAQESSGESGDGMELDPLFAQAKEVVLTDRKSSISYLQRKLQIGYNRSANIVDQLEKMGVLSPPNNKGIREILL